jgi:hypothetical protein
MKKHNFTIPHSPTGPNQARGPPIGTRIPREHQLHRTSRNPFGRDARREYFRIVDYEEIARANEADQVLKLPVRNITGIALQVQEPRTRSPNRRGLGDEFFGEGVIKKFDGNNRVTPSGHSKWMFCWLSVISDREITL